MADRLCDEILAGTYGDDDRVPSVREYAVAMEVNTNTAVKAYDTLARDGIIYNRRGMGYFVTAGASAQILNSRRRAFMHNALPDTPQVGCLTLSLGRLRQTQTASIHRLPRGLPGYLILFDTHAFELQRQLRYSRLPSQSEFFVISKHLTATRRIPPTSCALKSHSSRCNAQVEPRHFTTRLTDGLRSL